MVLFVLQNDPLLGLKFLRFSDGCGLRKVQNVNSVAVPMRSSLKLQGGNVLKGSTFHATGQLSKINGTTGQRAAEGTEGDHGVVCPCDIENGINPHRSFQGHMHPAHTLSCGGANDYKSLFFVFWPNFNNRLFRFQQEGPKKICDEAEEMEVDE
ncbi:uncharacterized protein LOC117646576 [Thrips palmi]|uniref:Uncharacterized protein LOC117646576 n=1 Tax=Thrips palmi TaxID=161013 RepID=A0A6P8Z0N3_THRPL|nr:uncharacterized protein LOC117646576 [Thrips palmi]